MEEFHVAIDGPAGSGKTTVSKLLSKKLGFDYLDTGAMYRAIGVYLNSLNLKPDDVDEIEKALGKVRLEYRDGKIYLNGEDVEKFIRTPQAGILASNFAKLPVVRRYLTEMQRKICRGRKIIVDGRDIGTVVLPNAHLKIFLTASFEERVRRRMKELKEKGMNVSREEIEEEVRKRDTQDSERETAPLRRAEDAIEIDTTNLTIEEVVSRIENMILEKLGRKVS
ncbi:MAG: (d)CMP kinase [Thermotogae bacterium]|nr:MAG: cytidylate kinase [Thermotoga sp. 4484_232]RKX47646.1 MAG: (d)CMP kinase [Thermotogota bacterium]RKX56748.1 MAG: (d)CMP kinase [Thermotoga sp.]